MNIASDFVGTSWLLIKLGALFGLLVYVVFSIIVVRQVGLMTETLEIEFETPIKVVAWLHLFFTIAVFLYVVFI